MEITASPDKVQLTQRQEDVLEVIRQHISEYGIPPTRAEIATSLGFRSVNAAEDHLRALARKGVISLSAGTSRGIQLKGQYRVGVPLVHAISSTSTLLSEQHIKTRIQIDPTLFLERPDYLYRVHDMSMRDAGIMQNDLLAVRKTHEAENGQVVVVRLHGRDLCVKRFFWRDKSHIELQSANPDFASIGIQYPTEHMQIEGVCVGVLRLSL